MSDVPSISGKPTLPLPTVGNSRSSPVTIPTVPILPKSSPRNVTVGNDNIGKSPSDSTQITINGQPVDKDAIPPIVIPVPRRPASPREAVPKLPEEVDEPIRPLTPNIAVAPIETVAPLPEVKVEIPKVSVVIEEPPVVQQPPPITQVVQPAPPVVKPPTPPVVQPAPPQPAPPVVQAPPQPEIPDYDAMTPDQQATERASFSTRFGILRRNNPTYVINEPSSSMPLREIHNQYLVYVKDIHVSRSVEEYKNYIVVGWLCMEVFAVKVLNLESARGYTQAQVNQMAKYEMLLIQLGERNYNSGGSSWPLEYRIFFLAAFNAVIFIAINILATYLGRDQAQGIVNALMPFLSGQQPAPQPAQGGLPQPPPPANPLGGLNLPQMLAGLGSLFNTPAAPAPAQQPAQQPAQPVRRRPTYDG